MRRWTVFWATWGGVGFSPIASGTVGTAAAIPFYLLLARLPLGVYLLVVVLFGLAACRVSAAAETIFGEKDSGKIVIDEVVGYLVTMSGMPLDWRWVVGGFFLFRLFDITKVPPARFFDRHWKNGYGVVLDDVVAGLYACLFLHLTARWL